MSFVPTQVRKLKAKLKPHHVKSREADGLSLHYLEGWHVMAEANRIFGFDGWDRETVSSTAVWTKQVGTRYCAAYVTRIRITVRAGEHKISREGCGAGESNAASPGQAHEFAAKAAETDATKRALSTFGNAFGLSLYGGAAEVRAEARRQADQREQVSGVNVAPPSAKSEVDQPTQSSRAAGTAIAPSHAHTPTFRDEGAPDIASATNASETASAEPDAERLHRHRGPALERIRRGHSAQPLIHRAQHRAGSPHQCATRMDSAKLPPEVPGENGLLVVSSVPTDDRQSNELLQG